VAAPAVPVRPGDSGGLTVTVRDGRIAGYGVIADPARLHDLDLGVLGKAAENPGTQQRGRA
jgi:hypothetical protein